MVPIGLKSGIFVGALLAAAAALPADTKSGDVENHYVAVGTAVAIVGAVGASAWNLGRKFGRIIDQGEDSKKDRAMIHNALLTAEEDTKRFREETNRKLTRIEVTIAGLDCNRTHQCPSKPDDP